MTKVAVTTFSNWQFGRLSIIIHLNACKLNHVSTSLGHSQVKWYDWYKTFVMWMHLGQMFMFPLSAIHMHQSWIRKDLECHTTQAYSEKCTDMLHFPGIFSLQKILQIRDTPGLSEAGRCYSHFRGRKPKAGEKTWCLVVCCTLTTSISCRWAFCFQHFWKSRL